MPKIKILLAVTKGTWGGAQKYVYDLATHLPPDKYEVTVLTGQPGRLVTELENRNIPFTVLPALGRDINPLLDLRSFFSLYNALRQTKPDILHLNSPKIGLIGALAGRLAKIKKIIYTSHGWPYREERPWFVKLFFKILCWKITWLCHETIAISQAEQTSKKFKLIYNGVAPIEFLSKPEARASLGLDPTSLVIGTIAELHHNKGLRHLAAAAKEVPTTFVVIGEGEERKNLEGGKLALVGQITNAATLLPAFDIFVLPSVKEGLPYVILEAGLAGLPVIATKVGGIPEIIENNVTGVLVPPRDSAALTQALTGLINQPEKRKLLGEKLRERVQNNFSLEKMVSETRTIYES